MPASLSVHGSLTISRHNVALLTALAAGVLSACAASSSNNTSSNAGNGGVTSNGGTTNGTGGSTSTSGGTSSGGHATGGGTSSGGTSSGGTSTGGSATGGTSTGGTATGGTSTGGNATGGTSTGGTSTGGVGAGGLPNVTGACAALVLDQSVSVASTNTDRVTWQDLNCQPRTAALAKAQGAWVRQFTYSLGGSTRTVTGTGVNGWNGFGYVVTHYGGGAAVSQGVTSTSSGILVGRHHAIYRFKFNHNIAGHNVPVTVDWFFADGRDHPVYAITYDSSGSAAGSIGADTRSPYGDMSWQGDGGNSTISGVGWGDHYKFVTTKAPLTDNSTWDYSKPNIVPYAMEWEDNPDAEMGSVQTQTDKQHDGGSAWFYGAWGKTSANFTKDAASQPNLMPVSWNWPYQLNQYELCFPDATGCANNTTGSHRVCWGANYGAIGGDGNAQNPDKTLYMAFGTWAYTGGGPMLKGYPYQSYSVYVVLGKHTTGAVAAQVAQVENVQNTSITATTGTVATTGPGGVGRTDTVTLAPVGYDHRYGTWDVTAAGNVVDLQVKVNSGALVSPVLVISNFTGTTAPGVTIDGKAATADTDYLMSLDTTNHQVWITFRPGWTGTQHIVVQ